MLAVTPREAVQGQSPHEQASRMSEYQRYEWMTSDRPLTRTQREAVNALSSHIDVSSTHALVEYHWSDFKHDPLRVLHDFFDGFLYWANWGAPELALRFPHGILPDDLLDGYDLDEFVTFRQDPDYDILDIHFGELEAPEEWVEYELGSLMALREELMDGDLRSLYIAWLASECLMGIGEGGDRDDQDDAYEDEVDDDDIDVPAIPPSLGTLTSAQQALAELLQIPQELLVAAGRHSSDVTTSAHHAEDISGWVNLLPPDRRIDYLVRLAHNEPGLSRRLMKELRVLSERSQSGKGSQNHRQDSLRMASSAGTRVPFAALLAESRAIGAQWGREQRELERRMREQRLQQIHEHQDEHWQRAEMAVTRGSGAGYDEAAAVLSELREVAARFDEVPAFEAQLRAWVRPHLRRPAFVKRLQEQRFPLPQG
jgi:hypothetical protein